jgi:hypothetical protein
MKQSKFSEAWIAYAYRLRKAGRLWRERVLAGRFGCSPSSTSGVARAPLGDVGSSLTWQHASGRLKSLTGDHGTVFISKELEARAFYPWAWSWISPG